jgi:TolA-binding protein
MASWLEQARTENAALPELVTGIQVAELREGIDTRLQRRANGRRLALSAAMMGASVVLWLLSTSPEAVHEPTRAATPTSLDALPATPKPAIVVDHPAELALEPIGAAPEPALPTPATGDARFEQMAADEHARALAIERMELKLKKQRDAVRDLLAAADLARQEGRAADAASALQTVVQKHASDPLAPSAAFSLGRVLLENQQRPADAAAAFALVAKLGPKNPLVEDALAREVEAWARAGDQPRAQAVARRYLERYPSGARAAAVRALAKLD